MCSSRWLWLALLAACGDAAQTGSAKDILNSAADSGSMPLPNGIGSGTAAFSSSVETYAAVSPDCTPDIGLGDLAHPISGPAAHEAAAVGGGFVLVKNWDFGKLDSVRDIAVLSSEFDYHDQFGTIANGSNYGAVTVAPNAATAVNAYNLNLPGDLQPVENIEQPYRELTEHSLRTYVRPLDPQIQDNVSASEHNAGNGSFMAKWHMAQAGSAFGHDVLWETRVRIPKPVQGYWFALWTSGTTWDAGPEIDVVESFGTPFVRCNAFQSAAVGGTNGNDFTLWPQGLDNASVPYAQRDLRDWHTWSLLYRKDDRFIVYYDGHLVQQGTIHWRVSGDAQGEVTGMHFLFDFSWGHTAIPDVNLALWIEDFPMIYEIDYSRVYMR